MDPVRLTKTMSETEFYGMLYAKPQDSYLNSGDILLSATVTESSGNIQVSSVSVLASGTQVGFYLSGGSVSNVYEIEVAAVTLFGRQPVRSFQLDVVPYVRAK